MSVTVNANLFRIVSAFVSSEETRYYLKGVSIEPHPHWPGVTLTATDGHRLLSVYDATGSASRAAIIALPKDTLKACKPAKTDHARTLQIEFGEAKTDTRATVLAAPINDAENAHPVAMAPRCEIDGSFPDWRRIAPCFPDDQTLSGAMGYIAYNATYITTFATAARELAQHLVTYRRDSGRLRIRQNGGAAALITFCNFPDAFGALMPMRSDKGLPELPAFLCTTPKQAKQAAE